MSFQKIFPVLLIGIIIGCSTNRPLITRGLNEDERRYYVVQNGYGITPEVRSSFLNGFISVGMEQELVFQLYGAPDRTIEDDTVWEYIDNKGQLVTGVKFEDKKVVEIMGDPRGGLPLETETK